MKANLLLAIFGALMFTIMLGLWLEREAHVCPVKLMSIMDNQRLLVERGYDIGGDGVDGRMGPNTITAFDEAYGNQCAYEIVDLKGE